MRGVRGQDLDGVGRGGLGGGTGGEGKRGSWFSADSRPQKFFKLCPLNCGETLRVLFLSFKEGLTRSNVYFGKTFVGPEESLGTDESQSGRSTAVRMEKRALAEILGEGGQLLGVGSRCKHRKRGDTPHRAQGHGGGRREGIRTRAPGTLGPMSVKLSRQPQSQNWRSPSAHRWVGGKG